MIRRILFPIIMTALSEEVGHQRERKGQGQHKREFDYMLQELSLKESALNQRIERFEQLVMSYLTGITALTSVVAILATSARLGQYTWFATALLLFAIAGFGVSLYFRMTASKVHITVVLTSCFAIRLYFASHFPKVVPYLECRDTTDLYSVWKNVFTRQAIILFVVMNGFSGLSLSIGIGILLAQTTSTIGSQLLSLPLIGLFGALILSLLELLLWLHLQSQTNLARAYVRRILDSAMSNTNIGLERQSASLGGQSLADKVQRP